MLVLLLAKFSHATLVLAFRQTRQGHRGNFANECPVTRLSSIRISDTIEHFARDYGRYLALTELPLLPAETRQVRANSVLNEKSKGDRTDRPPSCRT